MPGCMAPGCTSGYKNNSEKVHLFSVPKNEELKQKWEIALKRKKPIVSKTQVVCEKHFLPEDIIRCRHLVGPDGNILGVSKYQRPRLRPATVPSLFPWTEKIPATIKTENISESIPNSSQVSDPLDTSNMPEKIIECTSTSKTFDVIKARKFSELCPSIETQDIVTNPIQNNNRCKILENVNFSTLLSCDVNLPLLWRHHNMTYNGTPLISYAFASCDMVDGNYSSFNLKEIIVDSTLKLHTSILEKPLLDSQYKMNSISSIEELEGYIRKINGLNICNGTGVSDLQEYEKSTLLYTDKRNITRHKACILLCPLKRCHACRSAKDALVRKRKRHEISLVNKVEGQQIRLGSDTKGPENNYLKRLERKFKRCVEQKKKLRQINKQLRQNLKAYQSKMPRISEDDVQLNGSPSNAVANNQCDVVQEIINASHCKTLKGRRYSKKWLMLCMLLYLRSVSGYNCIRDNNILPLPSVNTMRRLEKKYRSQQCTMQFQF